MKKPFKRILSAVLTAVMILTAIPLTGIDFGSIFADKASAYDLSSYKVGDRITYGSYPQSKVTDNVTLIVLDSLSKNWTSYGYYSGTGNTDDGNMKPSGYMKYADISYNGNKYRAVTFSSYRPSYTSDLSSESNSLQDDNGYYTGNVYYFKYEPLTWRILDPAEGYVMCTKAIDSQAYQSYVYYNGVRYYNKKSSFTYASNWATSSIREWLNNDFYYTAFTEAEKAYIGLSYLENKDVYSSQFDSSPTYDKIFLLSYDDAINSKYGFVANGLEEDAKRQIKPTDYARCQGCHTITDTSIMKYYGNSWCWLRSSYMDSRAVAINGYGFTDDCTYYTSGVICSDGGIVPAFKFNPKSTIKPIPAPDNIKASNVASSGKIKLTWSPVNGATEYKIYRATSKKGTYKFMITTAMTSYINTSATAGKRYYYKIKAAATGAESEYSSIVSRTCDLARPVIKASNVASSGKVKLTWDAIEGATSYRVYRATSQDGTYTLMKTTSSTSYTNTSAVGGTKYYYKVKAICSNSEADSACSSVKSRICDLAKPTNVRVSLNSSGQPVVKWSKVDGAILYKVCRSTSLDGPYKEMGTTLSNKYTNTSFSSKTTYYYKVKAISSNSEANSAFSSIVSIKTK